MGDTKKFKYQKSSDRSKKHYDTFVTTDANLNSRLKFKQKIQGYWEKRDKLRETFYRKRGL